MKSLERWTYAWTYFVLIGFLLSMPMVAVATGSRAAVDWPPPAQQATAAVNGVHAKVAPDPCTIVAPEAPLGPEEAALLEALAEARRVGHQSRAHELQRRLGWTEPERGELPAGSRPAARVIREDLVGTQFLWQGDIQVSDPDVQDDHPQIASRADGTLYVVCDDVDLRNYLDVYTSTDDGLTWSYWFSLMGHDDDLTRPSAVVAEGDAPELLIAYEQAQGTTHCELWVHIEYLGTGLANFALIDAYPLDHRNPQICVDYPEYDYWYPYIVYASEVAGEPDYWQIRFRRSYDFGVTWTAPQVLATVFNTGDYGAEPDIDFGGSHLYVAYDRSDPSTEERDVLLRRSVNLGGSWDPEVELASSAWDESAPRVAATNGGGAVVVGYNRVYPSPENYDVEFYYSTNSGGTWDWWYFPYDETDEYGLDMFTSPSFGKIHAAFYRLGIGYGDIVYTWADHTSPASWSAVSIVNDGHYAGGVSGPAITVNPTKEEEACVAWGDVRHWAYEIYFDALYPLLPSNAPDLTSDPRSSSLAVFPSPMSDSGSFVFVIPSPARTVLAIFEPGGRRVATLVNQSISDGVHRLRWDGRDDRGRPVATGVYYVRLRCGDRQVLGRFALIR